MFRLIWQIVTAFVHVQKLLLEKDALTLQLANNNFGLKRHEFLPKSATITTISIPFLNHTFATSKPVITRWTPPSTTVATAVINKHTTILTSRKPDTILTLEITTAGKTIANSAATDNNSPLNRSPTTITTDYESLTTAPVKLITINTTNNTISAEPTTTSISSAETANYQPKASQRISCTKSVQCPTGQKCVLDNCVLEVDCPETKKFGNGPPSKCKPPTDPNNLRKSPLEAWFTEEVFNDLFPKANIGWGPHKCLPYSYEAFKIASRHFPRFAAESPNNGYSNEENHKRDLASFFAHAVQETGENDASLYDLTPINITKAHACFYRGGFFNWFEGGPISSFLSRKSPGYKTTDGAKCHKAGIYCTSALELDYWYPCHKDTERSNSDEDDSLHTGCYFGRGAIQISYNYNYGQFQEWLRKRKIFVDLLNEPNLVMTKMDPPLAIMASIWFYMTPQPPKPAMHDIVMGNWEPGEANRKASYEGAIFGPTSLVINNECNGEDRQEPGGPGESRRIKAFKWFCDYFGVPAGREEHLSCKGMPKRLSAIPHPLSWQPNWSSTWKRTACDCAPALHGGMIPYYHRGHYPRHFVEQNRRNRLRCVFSIYDKPKLYNMDNETSQCLNVPMPAAVPRSRELI